jgi:hypothetical protein
MLGGVPVVGIGSDGGTNVYESEHVIDNHRGRADASSQSAAGDACGSGALFGEGIVTSEILTRDTLHADYQGSVGVVETVPEAVADRCEAVEERQLQGLDANGFGVLGGVPVHIGAAGAT